jgi:hypothetical protein
MPRSALRSHRPTHPNGTARGESEDASFSVLGVRNPAVREIRDARVPKAHFRKSKRRKPVPRTGFRDACRGPHDRPNSEVPCGGPVTDALVAVHDREATNGRGLTVKWGRIAFPRTPFLWCPLLLTSASVGSERRIWTVEANAGESGARRAAQSRLAHAEARSTQRNADHRPSSAAPAPLREVAVRATRRTRTASCLAEPRD